jgi:release factor glutamine methyltransferase
MHRPRTVTIAEAISYASGKLASARIGTARLDAEVLLSRIIEKDRAWLFSHDRDELDEGQFRRFADIIARRALREPLQYITGRQEFWGLGFIVTPAVLIPRPETELLVETAIKLMRGATGPMTVVDLCTGSGCVAISLARELVNARVVATDISIRALAVARENAELHGVSERITFLEGDLFGPLEELDLRDRVDVITVNPPYVPSGDLAALQPEVKDHEPTNALIAGPDGMEIQRRIIDAGSGFLKQNGALIMEMGMGQADLLRQLVETRRPYDRPEILKDLAGIDRVLVAKKASSPVH